MVCFFSWSIYFQVIHFMLVMGTNQQNRLVLSTYIVMFSLRSSLFKFFPLILNFGAN